MQDFNVMTNCLRDYCNKTKKPFFLNSIPNSDVGIIVSQVIFMQSKPNLRNMEKGHNGRCAISALIASVHRQVDIYSTSVYNTQMHDKNAIFNV